MTRWHKESCQIPDVVLGSDNVPSCNACGRSCPAAEELIATRAGTNSAPEMPPDKPPGQMNLWWPKCVPFVGDLEETHQGSSSLPSEGTDRVSVTSTAYPEMLKSTEFRLACLSTVSDEEAPIHLTLEVYPDDDHPEYECASYTWGGEEGDSTLCQPIYLGPYWDVLLQTRNCYSLLKFLRPWRGIRMVWVDAICIDQESLVERAIQVTKMKSIYRACSRVVVYLGKDVVSCSKRFPSSAPLHALRSDESVRPEDPPTQQSDISLTQLFSRKYFSRLWVIQELIVAPSAIIRVGDINYRVDAEIMTKLDDIDENTFTSAPWARFMTRCSIPISGDTGGNVGVFRLTAHSCASDPRDRLFGIISLVSEPSIRLDLAPDYTLSFQQFNIGLFAYLLLVNRECWFLWYAGSIAKLAYQYDQWTPSWVPNCRLDEIWQKVMASTSSTASLYGSRDPEDSRRSKTIPFVLHEDPPCTIQISRDSRLVAYRQLDRSLLFNDVVERATGALLLSMTRILSLKNGITLTRRFGRLHLYALNYQDEKGTILASSLMLVAMDQLDIQPDTDHIFIPHSMPNLYFVLRNVEMNRAPNIAAYEFVTSRIRLVDNSKLEASDLDRLQGAASNNTDSWSRILSIPIWPYSLLEEMHGHVATILYEFQRATSLDFWTKKEYLPGRPQPFGGHGTSFKIFFLRTTKPFEPPISEPDALLFRIIQLCEIAIHAGKAGETAKRISAALIESIDPRFEPELQRISECSYIVLKISTEEWYVHFEKDLSNMVRVNHGNSYYNPPDHVWWDWQYEGELEWRTQDFGSSYQISHGFFVEPIRPQLFQSLTEWAGVAPPKRIRIRVKVPQFINILHKHLGDAPSLLRRLMYAYEPPLELDAVLQMVKNGPTEEQHHMLTPKYAGGGVRIDGTQSRVRIV